MCSGRDHSLRSGGNPADPRHGHSYNPDPRRRTRSAHLSKCSRSAAARLLRRPPDATPDPTTPHLALAVWPPANPALPDSYLAASRGRHHVPPELAARAILTYTDPGDLVLDPCCAAGSVLVEAIRHGRRAIGLTTNHDDGALAVANISRARQQGAAGRATILTGNPRQLPRLFRNAAPILDQDTPGQSPRHPAGSSRLILTAARDGDPAELLPALRTVLAPGGFLLLTLDQPQTGTAVGLAATIDAAEQAGLHYWQHVIALRIATHDHRRSVLLHTDVLAFRKPVPARATTTASQAVSA